MNESQNLPSIPLSTGIRAGSGQIVNITRDAGGAIYSLIFPEINATGYLYNDGIGNLDWGVGPQGPKGDQGIQGIQGVSGTGGGGSGQISFIAAPTDMVLNLVQDTPTIANPATTLLNTNDSIFTMPSNGRIRYTATGSKYYKIMITVSGHTLQSNVTVKYHIYKNTSTSMFSVKRHHNNQEYEVICITFITLLNQNDFIELYLESDGTHNYHLGSLAIALDPC